VTAPPAPIIRAAADPPGENYSGAGEDNAGTTGRVVDKSPFL
jgi:hypothetical protein